MMAAKSVFRVMLGAGAILCILLAALFFVPRDLVPDLARQIAAVANKPIVVNGPARLHLFPAPRAVLQDVHFAGRTGEPFVRIERLVAGVRLWPLFIGRVEAKSFDLEAPHIQLSINEDGAVNWSFYSQEDFDAISVANPRIGTITVADGKIDYRDARSGRVVTVENIDAEIEWSRFTSGFEMSASMEWNGETHTVDIASSEAVSLMFGGISTANIGFQNRLSRGRLSGRLSAGPSSGFNGTLDVAIDDLQQVARWWGLDASGRLLPTRVEIDGRIRVRDRSVSFNDVALDLDGQRADGAFSLDLSRRSPPIKGTLAFDTLNLDTALAATGPGGGGSDRVDPSDITAPGDLVAGDQSIDLRVSANTLGFAGLAFRDVALALTVEHGRADLGVGNAGIAGGILAGAATLDTKAKPENATVILSMENIELTDLSERRIGIGWLDGTLNAVVDMTAAGADWSDVIETARGAATVSVTDGSFKLLESVELVGPDIPGVARVIAEETLRRQARDLAFDRAVFDIRIDGHRARFAAIDVAGSDLRLTGGGDFDLTDGRVDFDLAASAEGGTDGDAVPIKVSGVIGDVSASADLIALARLLADR